MAGESYGFQEPMENDAMVRTLDAQARAIWPQEKPVIARVFARQGLDVLDVGCGTGEISLRVAKEFAPRSVTGVDLSESHLRHARARAASSEGVTFEQGDALALRYPESRFDTALCRHMLHAIPDPPGVIREMIRVIKPGGWLYYLAEDYGMLFFHPGSPALDQFFHIHGVRAGRTAGGNIMQGRTMPTLLASMGCAEIALDYLCIDTLRVDRELLAEIFIHWRDGFVEWISSNAGIPPDDVRARFDEMIACARGPVTYAAWLIPCVSARVTGETKRLALVTRPRQQPVAGAAPARGATPPATERT